uniref:Transcription and mRNA export factor ENY2 n=1 Tax=Onchocerca volvulus TaxID=6282 RepID=A0A2K6VT43_ONCVO
MSASSISKAALERKFIECGERDRMKDLFLRRLRESGWIKEVENMCRIYIQNKDIEQLTLDDILSDVRVRAIQAVPDEVKRELMHCIRSSLQQQFV